jgi:hypothetical protein
MPYLTNLLFSVERIDIRTNKQKEPWFIDTLNPNGRIPVLVDRNRPSTTGAEGFAVFETAAILLYVSQHYDPEHKLWFDVTKQPEDYSEMLQWIFFAVRLPIFERDSELISLFSTAVWGPCKDNVRKTANTNNQHSPTPLQQTTSTNMRQKIFRMLRNVSDPFPSECEAYPSFFRAHRLSRRDQTSLRGS